MTSVHFTNIQAARTYFNCKDNHTVEKLGRGLETLVSMRETDKCSHEEFSSLKPRELIKAISQAAKGANLYKGQLDQLIRPLRGRIKEQAPGIQRNDLSDKKDLSATSSKGKEPADLPELSESSSEPPSAGLSSQAAVPNLQVEELDENSQLCVSVKNDLIELYNPPNSKFRRWYPPLSSCDTCGPLGVSKPFISSLLSKLKVLAAGKTIEESPNKEYFSIPYGHGERCELDWLAKQLFPEFKPFNIGGAHGYGLSFPDEAIKQEYEVLRTIRIGNVEVKYTKNGKPIVLQRATRGCTAGCSAMLGLEHQTPKSLGYMVSRNLGDNGSVVWDLEDEFGLAVISGEIQDLESLKEVLKLGSVMIGVTTVGSHVILVDAVEDDCVRIRDPYHGWEVDIFRSFFEGKLSWDHTYLQVSGRLEEKIMPIGS